MSTEDSNFVNAISAAIESANSKKSKKDKEESSFLEGLALLETADWAGQLRYNEITRTIEKREDIEEINLRRGLWTDEDEYQVKIWLHRKGVKVGVNIVHELVTIIALKSRFNPIEEHIDTLPPWDGEKRLDTWTIDYCGAEDNEYSRTVGRRFLIQMLSRGIEPGCKADAMLILEGTQGKMKSSFLEALASEELFSDALPSLMNDKEAADHLQGLWLVEVSELESLKRAGVDTIKRFLSRRVDSYRPAYGRNKVTRQRQCVFVGTTNREEYLTDYTGNRRFLPLRVGDIDLDGFIEIRDQLLAEAKSAAEDHEKHWFDPDEFGFIEEAQESRRQIDPWEEELEEAFMGMNEVTNREIYSALGLDKDLWRQDKRTAGRKNAVMIALGWVPCRTGRTRGFKRPVPLEPKNPSPPVGRPPVWRTGTGPSPASGRSGGDNHNKNGSSDNKNTKNDKHDSSTVTEKNQPEQTYSNAYDSSDSNDINICGINNNYRKEEKESCTSQPSQLSQEEVIPSSERENTGDSPPDDVNDTVTSLPTENMEYDYPDDRVKCMDCRSFMARRERCFKFHCGVVPDLLRRCDEFQKKS